MPVQEGDTNGTIQLVKQAKGSDCLFHQPPLQVVIASWVEVFVLSRQAWEVVSSADISGFQW